MGGCTRVQKPTGGNAVSTTREVQTEEKADTWMKEVESSSIPGQDIHRSQNPGCPNIPTSEAVPGSSGSGCTSSFPPNQQPSHSSCLGSNMNPAAPCKAPASATSCQQSSECEAPGTRSSVAKAANGVRGKSEGRGSKAGHQRRLVINLDDKNKFTEEVTV